MEKETENEFDWSIPRKNINPKTKKPYQRGRNWAIIVYPDSVPENWIDLIKQEPNIQKEKNNFLMKNLWRDS